MCMKCVYEISNISIKGIIIFVYIPSAVDNKII